MNDTNVYIGDNKTIIKTEQHNNYDANLCVNVLTMH